MPPPPRTSSTGPGCCVRNHSIDFHTITISTDARIESTADIRARWCGLPEGVAFRHLLGAGLLGGIGFTMSIFITNLAFSDADHIQNSKIAILFASLLASGLGLLALGMASRRRT